VLEVSVTRQESGQFILSETDKLDFVDKFCYLKDMLGKTGGAEEASRT
jgi:hypothetical protein